MSSLILLIEPRDALLKIAAADTAEEPSSLFLLSVRAAITKGDDPGIWCVPGISAFRPVSSGFIVAKAALDLAAFGSVQVDDGA